MDRNRGLIPRSFFPDLFSSNFTFPSSWEDAEDKMSQWLGKNTGVTVSEDDKNVYIEAHLPGLKPEDLDISLDRNTLRIRGEKKEETAQDERKFYRRAQRSFFYQVELPTQVQENTEQAQYEDGILQITFKKAYKENVKKIAVKGSQSRGSSTQQSSTTTTQQKTSSKRKAK